MAKAKKIPYLEPEKDLKSCLSKILRTRFEEMVVFERGTLEGADIEKLHDMRVASRRVQAVMKVFRAAFPRNEFNKQYKVIRGLKDVLGEVRHYDVFIDTLQKYRDEYVVGENTNNGRNGAKRATGTNDGRAIELLIIRQKALREGKRRELVRYIRGLNREGYKGSFSGFCGRSLNIKNTKYTKK